MKHVLTAEQEAEIQRLADQEDAARMKLLAAIDGPNADDGAWMAAGEALQRASDATMGALRQAFPNLPWGERQA